LHVVAAGHDTVPAAAVDSVVGFAGRATAVISDNDTCSASVAFDLAQSLHS
jgi:hypothetical protein